MSKTAISACMERLILISVILAWPSASDGDHSSYCSHESSLSAVLPELESAWLALRPFNTAVHGDKCLGVSEPSLTVHLTPCGLSEAKWWMRGRLLHNFKYGTCLSSGTLNAAKSSQASALPPQKAST